MPSLVCPALNDWCRRLEASPLIGTPGQWRPLILDRAHYLYLHRLYHDEQLIARHLHARGRSTGGAPVQTQWAQKLRRYFPPTRPGEIDGQMAAAVIALMRRLLVISGAPGTGKTTTAARIIGLLIDVYSPQPLRFALCAPTGKAAARLGEALRAAAAALPGNPEERARFPTEASTIHRLLGYRRNRFVFDAANPLPADVVVVDEASMIDLALMARLIEAIPPDARLIILGDHHQLSSVEAGAVMGDICRGGGVGRRSEDLESAFRRLRSGVSVHKEAIPLEASALHDNIIVLTQNYRFDAQTGIGALIEAVNAGNTDAVFRQLRLSGAATDWIPAPLSASDRRRLRTAVMEGYRPLFAARSVQEALDALEGFMVLGALIGGPWGTDRLNVWIESLARRAGWIETDDVWYRGRPIMIRRNDYRAGLFNGDIGLVWPEPLQGKTVPRIWFRTAAGPLRAFAPEQLPEHQTALALTVHKSQGSEYRRIVMALPEKDSPLLSRELLYTGLSRAREQIWMVVNESVLDLAVNRRIDRASGLTVALERQSRAAAGIEVQQDTEGESGR